MDGASLSKKEGERKLSAHYLFVTERLGRAGGSELIGTCPENRNSEPDDDSRAQEFGLFVKSTKFFFVRYSSDRPFYVVAMLTIQDVSTML